MPYVNVILIFFLIFKKCFYLFLKERERQSMSGKRGRKREGDTESEAGSRFCTVSTEPDGGLELPNREIMT